MKILLFITALSGIVLTLQPIVLLISSIVRSFVDNEAISRNNLFYKFCKWLKVNAVIRIVSIISAIIFALFLIITFTVHDTIAIYNEKDYDVESMAMDLTLLADYGENYQISYTKYKNDDGEKEIRVYFYKALEYYQIICYGIKSVNLGNSVLNDISTKYKK